MLRGCRPRKTFSATVSAGISAQFLIDHADAAGLGVGRRAEAHDLARAARTRPRRALDAAEDFHQRALAGAVLAEQPVDLAGQQLEIDPAERDGAAEPLGDPAQLEDRLDVDWSIEDGG